MDRFGDGDSGGLGSDVLVLSAAEGIFVCLCIDHVHKES